EFSTVLPVLSVAGTNPPSCWAPACPTVRVKIQQKQTAGLNRLRPFFVPPRNILFFLRIRGSRAGDAGPLTRRLDRRCDPEGSTADTVIVWHHDHPTPGTCEDGVDKIMFLVPLRNQLRGFLSTVGELLMDGPKSFDQRLPTHAFS